MSKYRPDFSSLLRTLRTAFKCSSSLPSVYVNISSKLAVTFKSRCSQSCSFTYRKNVAGALTSPNGVTNHSNRPSLQRNAVSHSSPSFIRTRWKADFTSSFVNHLAFESCLNVSLNNGSGYRSGIVIAFSPQ